MSVKRPLVALLAAASFLALPAAAAGQSAGDQQYEDPLPSGPVERGDRAPRQRSGPPASPPAAEPAASEALAGGETVPVAPAASGQELPRTGLPAGLIAAAGAALCGAGAALRSRVR